MRAFTVAQFLGAKVGKVRALLFIAVLLPACATTPPPLTGGDLTGALTADEREALTAQAQHRCESKGKKAKLAIAHDASLVFDCVD